MKISNLIEGKFIERPNRFTIAFESNGLIERAHLRDPGRLKELLLPGARLLIRPALNTANRKTKYDIIAIWSEGIWVLINSGFHSDLAAELIESGHIKELYDYYIEKREYTFGKSRIDFLLNNKSHKMLLEVKGCTLVELGHAKFPDAPTERGKRHLEELIKAKKEGFSSAVLFIIPREDPKMFSPNWEMDPEFSETLAQAEHENVYIVAYSFKTIFNNNELEIKPLKRVKIKI
ncbi:MAG TPA: DNA/RNA nuclease SfsA [Methanobacteriaceae archaeon]|nr:DNA/RNA nuclease SfsA [Methanobacteriaceae archaeon]